MNELHQGQGMDIYFRDNYICPTEEEYKIMVCKKTGGLFRMAYRLMQAHSDVAQTRDLMPLIDELGYYFQILDDYCNLQSQNYYDNKTFCPHLLHYHSHPFTAGDREGMGMIVKWWDTKT